jgi:methanethiol S-methyltransferase
LLRGGSAGRIVRVCTALAIIHSILASRQMKEFVAGRVGSRYRNGLYRFAYIVQSTLFFTWLFFWVLRLPDRELYNAKPPWSWLMRAGQAAFMGIGFSGVRVIGIPDFNGMPQLQALIAGDEPHKETEAQGPPRDSSGEMVREGMFRYTRHPGNLAPIGVMLLFPRMTVNRAALALMTILYAVLGSIHEEYRHWSQYPSAYKRYQRDVPFLVPLPGRSADKP